MEDFRTKNGYTIIRTHLICILSKFLKFWFLILLALFLYFFALLYVEGIYFEIWFEKYINEVHNTWFIEILFFLAIFFILNYAFISLILILIEYSYNLVIIYEDQIVLIKSSLILQDYIEVINASKIVKVDAFLNWFFSNLLRYWDLVIEQQKSEVKIFNHIPRPYDVLLVIKKQRDSILNDMRKKYIVHDEIELDDNNNDKTKI